MVARLTIFNLVVGVLSGVNTEGINPFSDEFIYVINSKQNYWKAARNFPAHTPLSYFTRLMATLKNEAIQDFETVKHDAGLIANLPESFDPRDKWPNCSSLNEIRDQGSCGSCWAFGAVEAMIDRYCIHSNGIYNFHFSAQDLISCCQHCSIIGFGCYGGDIPNSWKYWKDFGIVSGGSYNSSQGCRPYEIPPCEHMNITGHLSPCGNKVPKTPKCIKTCRSGYKKEYSKDKRHGKNVYTVPSDEEQIKAELFTNGPVETDFIVYEDFIHYKQGVYKHTEGKNISHHAVKMLGWGVENGLKYWLVANSWNPDWGDKGFFKILRGENHCDIESGIVAGEPLIQEWGF